MAELSVDGHYSRRPDVAIVVYGESPYAESLGDRATLEYQSGADAALELLRRLHEARIPIVSVFLSGRPLQVQSEIDTSDAFVAAWLPGTEGAGMADVLIGDAAGLPRHDFSGGLSFGWADGAGQTLPLGYGLRYRQTCASETVALSSRLRNTPDHAPMDFSCAIVPAAVRLRRRRWRRFRRLSSSGSSGSSSSCSSSSSSSSSSSGSGPAFWLPYQATPAASGGETGLFVIPSNALTSAPVCVTTSAKTKFLAASFTTTISASHIVTAYSPAQYLYAAADSSNNIHIYKLDLALGTTPTPTQLSALSLPLSPGAAIDTVICDSNRPHLLTPTSLFVVLHIAGAAGCGTADDVWMEVHSTDTVTASPPNPPIASTQFTPHRQYHRVAVPVKECCRARTTGRRAARAGIAATSRSRRDSPAASAW